MLARLKYLIAYLALPLIGKVRLPRWLATYMLGELIYGPHYWRKPWD